MNQNDILKIIGAMVLFTGCGVSAIWYIFGIVFNEEKFALFLIALTWAFVIFGAVGCIVTNAIDNYIETKNHA